MFHKAEALFNITYKAIDSWLQGRVFPVQVKPLQAHAARRKGKKIAADMATHHRHSAKVQNATVRLVTLHGSSQKLRTNVITGSMKDHGQKLPTLLLDTCTTQSTITACCLCLCTGRCRSGTHHLHRSEISVQNCAYTRTHTHAHAHRIQGKTTVRRCASFRSYAMSRALPIPQRSYTSRHSHRFDDVRVRATPS